MMMIRLAAPVAVLALSCAGPLYAAAHESRAEPSPEQATPDDAKKDRQRKVCRTETATGSVMPKRVCRTVAQIETDERNAEQLRDRQNRIGASAR